MRDAGVAEQVPVLALDGRLVAHRQGREHAGGAAVVHRGIDRVAHALARPLDDVPRLAFDELRRRRVAHGGRRSHALLEQRELVVEAVRVDVAVRLAQLERETPALASAELELRQRQRGVFMETAVPADRDERRHGHGLALARGRLDLEAKAQPRRAALRQARDDADDLQLLAFERRRQVLRQPVGRTPAGGTEAECCDAHQCEHEAAPPSHHDAERAQHERRDIPGQRQQRALLQLQSRTGQPGQRQPTQAPPRPLSRHVSPRSLRAHPPRRRAPGAARRRLLPCTRSVGFATLSKPLKIMSVYDRLKELGIELPPLAIPAAAYVPFVRTGHLVFVSGHIAKRDGKPWVGQLGRDIDTATGKQAARAVAIDLLGTLHAAVGDLNKVERIVKVMSLVNSTPTFTEQHLVTNGCSELLGEVFAEKGAHARSAFGVAQIPMGACVEIELIAQVA